jgi:dTDP-4-dehydrorhamnose reductase
MKILTLGNGFVGKPLAEYLNSDTTNKRLHEITLEDLQGYDVVINTAAKTAIDWCDKNREETYDTNVVQAIRIAKLAKEAGCKHLFFSSGCIFKSDNVDEVNYEDSIPNPQCFYTYTKLLAEQVIEEVSPETLIIRPRLLISEKSHPRNTINKLLSYENVIDNQETATILEDLIVKIKELLNESGAYNIFNEGTISPSEIMDMWNHTHTKITKADLDDLTKGKARRVSTILGSRKTKPMPNIKTRLQDIKQNWG